MSIVPTNISYNSDILQQNLYDLIHIYPFINISTAGNSVLGKPIYVIKLGNGSKKVFYSASIHANEWITSLLLMKFVESYCVSYTNHSNLYGYSVRDIFNSTSIFIIPMVNPDGITFIFIGTFVVTPLHLLLHLIFTSFIYLFKSKMDINIFIFINFNVIN